MNTVNNFKLLAEKLFPNGECEAGEFYFVQVLVRGKDGNNVNGNNKNRLVRFYVVRSAEKLMEIEPEVIELCRLHNARAYIHPTPRNDKDVASVMLKDAVKEFTDGNYHMFRRLFSTACGKSFVEGKKLFIVDLDREQMENPQLVQMGANGDAAECVQWLIRKCRGRGGEDAEKVVARVPTKSGVHLICKPFDVGQMEGHFNLKGIPVPDVHKNNPTVLFCYKA